MSDYQASAKLGGGNSVTEKCFEAGKNVKQAGLRTSRTRIAHPWASVLVLFVFSQGLASFNFSNSILASLTNVSKHIQHSAFTLVSQICHFVSITELIFLVQGLKLYKYILLINM